MYTSMKKNRLKYPLLLAAIILFHTAGNYIWIKHDNDSLGADIAHHLINKNTLYHQLCALLSSPLPVFKKMTAFFTEAKSPVYFLTSIFNLIFGNSSFVTRFSGIFYLIILILSVYHIGKRVHSKNAGILSACMVTLYPSIWGISRLYHIDFALIAVCALCFLLLLYSSKPGILLYPVFFGILSGIAVYIKPQVLIFLAGPFLSLFIKNLANPIRDKSRGIFAQGVIKAVSAVALIWLVSYPWWHGHWDWVRENLLLHAFYSGQPAPERFLHFYMPKLFSPEGLLFYARSILLHVSPVFCAVFIAAILFPGRAKELKNKSELFLWIVIPYLVFTFTAVKEDRYIFPSYPAVALISASLVYGIRSIAKRRALIFILISAGVIQYFFLSFSWQASNFWTHNLFSRYDLWYYHPPLKNNISSVMAEFNRAINDKYNSGDKYFNIGIIESEGASKNEMWRQQQAVHVIYYYLTCDFPQARRFGDPEISSGFNRSEIMNFLIIIGAPDETQLTGAYKIIRQDKLIPYDLAVYLAQRHDNRPGQGLSTR